MCGGDLAGNPAHGSWNPRRPFPLRRKGLVRTLPETKTERERGLSGTAGPPLRISPPLDGGEIIEP